MDVGGHRPDHGEVVGDAGGVGEGFAELEAGDAGGDGAEGAADIDGGVGFGVEGLVLGRTSAEEEDDAGFGAAEAGGAGEGGGRGIAAQ
jgi:hypothetical protein